MDEHNPDRNHSQYNQEPSVEQLFEVSSKRFRYKKVILLVALPLLLIALVMVLFNSNPDQPADQQNTTATDSETSTQPERNFGEFSQSQIRSYVEDFMDLRTKERVGAASQQNPVDYLQLDNSIDANEINLSQVGYTYQIFEILEPQNEQSLARVVVDISLDGDNQRLEELVLIKTNTPASERIQDKLKIQYPISSPTLTLDLNNLSGDYVIDSIIKRKQPADDLSNMAAVVYPVSLGQFPNSNCNAYGPNECFLIHTSSISLSNASWKLHTSSSTLGQEMAVVSNLSYFVLDENDLVFKSEFGDADFYASWAYRADLAQDNTHLLYITDNFFSTIDDNDIMPYDNQNERFLVQPTLKFDQACNNASPVEINVFILNRAQRQAQVNSCIRVNRPNNANNSSVTNIYSEVLASSGDVLLTIDTARSAENRGQFLNIDSVRNLDINGTSLIFELFGTIYELREAGPNFQIFEL